LAGDDVLEELEEVRPKFTPSHEIWLEFQKLKTEFD